jgi:hypothetical protein
MENDANDYQINTALWKQRFLYPWIKIDTFHYYCANCCIPQKLTLSDGPEDLERFIKAHSKCKPREKQPSAPIDTPPEF